MSPLPRVISANTVKSKLLKPAQTSIYEVSIPNISGSFLSDRQVTTDKQLINLSCSEASLPGSSIATSDMPDKFHGSTHRYGYRRQYDDRADFTFYVDAPRRGSRGYDVLWFFEQWISLVVGEDNLNNQRNEQFSYRVNYPNTYRAPIYITKFEKDLNLSTLGKSSFENRSYLQYEFVKAFPISITSMPVSYEQSQILKCTVSFTYIRYVVDRGIGGYSDATSMRDQASRNSAALDNSVPPLPGIFDTPNNGFYSEPPPPPPL